MGMEQVDWKIVTSAISMLIALASLAVVIFKEFLQGARLVTAVDRISLLRMPPLPRQEISIEILIDDLLSDPRSAQATNLLQSIPGLADAVNTKERRQIAATLDAHGRRNQIIYEPSRNAVERYFSDRRFVMNFYVPLIIANSGRQTGYLSSLVLVVRDMDDLGHRWAFIPYFLVDSKNLLDGLGEGKDTDRISGLFVGVSVPPSSSIEVHPWFVPLPDADNHIISRTNMVPGNYEARIYGYGSEGRRLLRTEWYSIQITDSQMHSAFRGCDMVNNITIEKHVADAINDDA